MVKAISSINIAKKSIAGAMLIGASCAAVAQNKPIHTNINLQTTELLSKEAASALRAQVLKDTVVLMPDGNAVKYDSAGRVVEEYCYDEDSQYGYYVYKYNEDGTPKQDTKYSPDGDMEWAMFYFYGPDGLESDMTMFKDIIWVRHLDSNGYITNAIVRDTEGNVLLQYVYTTDSSGKRIETIYDADGKQLEN